MDTARFPGYTRRVLTAGGGMTAPEYRPLHEDLTTSISVKCLRPFTCYSCATRMTDLILSQSAKPA